MSSSHSDFYKVTDLELTSIADAIRIKGSTSSTLTFPSGFISAIENIPVGGGIDDLVMGEMSILSGEASYIIDHAIVMNTHIKELYFPQCITIQSYAFQSCTSLTTASFPKCTSISDQAFHTCYSLINFHASLLEYIGNSAFQYCSNLQSVSFSNLTYVGSAAFRSCYNLSQAYIPNISFVNWNVFDGCNFLTDIILFSVSLISNYAFRSCYRLMSVNLTGVSSVPTLGGSQAFTSTPIGGYSQATSAYGSIYVPASLLTAFQTATNWTYFSDRMVGV